MGDGGWGLGDGDWVMSDGGWGLGDGDWVIGIG